MKKVPCACGCGKRQIPFDSRGRPRRYIAGHSCWLGKRRPNCTKPYGQSTEFSARSIARRRKGARDKCELRHIGHCKGPIHVAHKDHNPWNNDDPANLLALCATHHRLYDLGRIDLAKPKMPAFYTDSGGKRRYVR